MRVSKCVTKHSPVTKRYQKAKPGTKGVNFKVSWLYDADVAFIKERGIPINVALRDSLFEYVLTIKAKERALPALHTMTKAERDGWIMSAKDDYTTRQEPAIAVAAAPEIIQGPAPDMSTWTKAERDAWIIDGTIPARVMMAKKMAGARASMDCTD